MISLLLILFLLPFLGSILLLFLGPLVSSKVNKVFAITFSLIPLFLLILNASEIIGMRVQLPWLPSLSIAFRLYVDSIALLFLFLTAIVIPISIAAFDKESYTHLFYAFVLGLEGLLFGFFMARDLVLFILFWEAMLLPLYFIIALWGNTQRRAASIKFLIYLMAGSALLIVAALALYFTSDLKTFNMDVLSQTASASPYALALFLIFMLAFAVKTPLFPFHAWLPDAYYEAPIAGSILLSAILSKAGIYGILRIGIGFFPTLISEWGPLLLGFAIAGVLYGGFAAWMQDDFKRLIAYSSFSHVNFVLAGLFIVSEIAHTGAIVQAINHGITITGLFLVVGWLIDRLGSSSIYQGGGLAKEFTKLCWITLFFGLSSIALPGTNNFIGEFLILFAGYKLSPWIALLLGLTAIISVIYMLRWIHSIYFGATKNQPLERTDIDFTNVFITVPLILIILWIGIYPKPILNLIQPNRIAANSTALDMDKST